MRRVMVERILAYAFPRRVGLGVALAGFAADVASKGMALSLDADGVLPWWLVPHQVGVQLQWNTGMSFSLLQNVVWGPVLLAAVAVVASVFFVRWLGESRDGLHQFGVGLVLAGALGNLLDRLVHGAVVDFLLVNPWGLFPYTFNVADACITVGVSLLLLHGFLTRKANN
jgi:signal peptidase II